MRSKFLILLTIPLCALRAQEAQTPKDTQALLNKALERLEALEKENARLASDIHSLQQELTTALKASADSAPTDERMAVAENRIAEQAQTKVEASNKFPLSIYGMFLFNAFTNSRGVDAFTAGSPLLTGPERDGATLTQSILGVQFHGPKVAGGGQVSGSLTMDFWGNYQPEFNRGWFRIREGALHVDWANRSISFGQEKPLISPLQPESLAEVAIPPLSGAGNLWYWLPQIRYEERVPLNGNNGVKLQASVIQTAEPARYVEESQAPTLARARPGFEGRVAYWRQLSDNRRLEVGGGFHVSSTHVNGLATPSKIASVDWTYAPLSKLQISGTFYKGQNVAPLGSLGNGFLSYGRSIKGIETTAGWTQLAFPVTKQLKFHLWGGMENDKDARYGPSRDFTYAGNVMYQAGPNVVLSLEGLQMRLRYLNGSNLLVNQYNLGVAYLF